MTAASFGFTCFFCHTDRCGNAVREDIFVYRCILWFRVGVPLIQKFTPRSISDSSVEMNYSTEHVGGINTKHLWHIIHMVVLKMYILCVPRVYELCTKCISNCELPSHINEQISSANRVKWLWLSVWGMQTELRGPVTDLIWSDTFTSVSFHASTKQESSNPAKPFFCLLFCCDTVMAANHVDLRQQKLLVVAYWCLITNLCFLFKCWRHFYRAKKTVVFIFRSKILPR